MGSRRGSALDFYNSVSSDIYLKSMFDRYWLPLDENRTVLVVSTSSTAAAFWVVAYTVLVTMIFMAACELATLGVLTWFKAGSSGTRHAMLVSYYNAGSPSRILPLMTGYIYNGLFRCRRAGQPAVDWKAVKAGLLLFSLALSLLSADMLTKFFLGGRALIQGNVAQANPKVVFYPDFVDVLDQNIRDAYKAVRAPAVYQAIARKTSMGEAKLQSHIAFDEQITPLRNNNWSRKFTYAYNISGYELGLRDAPGLLFSVNGNCETSYAENSVISEGPVEMYGTPPETIEDYPFWADTSEDVKTWGTATVLPDRENYTAPWVFYHTDLNPAKVNESKIYGGYAFQLVPHTGHRVSSSENLEDPWYQTEPNPIWLEGDPEGPNPYTGRYRVKSLRPPMRCIQNDTYTYNGHKVTHVDNLGNIPGLEVSNFTQFVLSRELGVPVLSALLSYAPFATLYSGVHFISNQRRLDAQRANMSTDFRELVQIGYVYSREIIRNTVLLFPSLEQQLDLGSGTNEQIVNGAHTDGRNNTGIDFLVDSSDVAALSVITLIVTPTVCVILWIVVLSWTWAFTSQSKLDNASAIGRHNLRRAGLQAAHLYRFVDEALSHERKWSGRNTNTPFIRDLSMEKPPLNTNEKEMQIRVVSSPVSERAEMIQGEEGRSDYPKPKLVPVAGFLPLGNDPLEENRGVWVWVKRNIFGIGRTMRERYEVTLTKAWDPRIPKVRRGDILEDV